MLKKLKSVLKSHQGSLLTLAFKALIFSGLLYLSKSHWLAIIGFVIVSFYFYFQSFFNVRQFLASFLILVILSSFFISQYSILNIQFSIFSSLFFGFLFFLILGVKNLIFIKREPLYYLLNGFLFLAIFAAFFYFGKIENSWLFFIKSLSVFIMVFFILREFFVSPKRNLMAAVLSFVLIQFLWIIAFLPLNFINAASLALLIALILEDFALNHLNGVISRKIILRNIGLFLILALIIFAISIKNYRL